MQWLGCSQNYDISDFSLKKMAIFVTFRKWLVTGRNLHCICLIQSTGFDGFRLVEK